MIKVEKGSITLKGSIIDLRTELALLVHRLSESIQKAGASKEEVDEMLRKTLEVGLMKQEDVVKEVEKALFSDDFLGVMEEFMDFLREKREEK